MKNRMVKNSPPDFAEIQRSLATDWQKKQSKTDTPSDSTQSESEKDSNPTM